MYWPEVGVTIADGITLLGGVGITITVSRYIFDVSAPSPAPMNTVGVALSVTKWKVVKLDGSVIWNGNAWLEYP